MKLSNANVKVLLNALDLRLRMGELTPKQYKQEKDQILNFYSNRASLKIKNGKNYAKMVLSILLTMKIML